LSRAAAIIAGARTQAESIIADATEQADQIIADARLHVARVESRERRLALTGTRVRDTYDGGMCAVWFALIRDSAGFHSAESLYRLSSLSSVVDHSTSDDKADVPPGSRALKWSLDAQQDRETPGWLRRNWRSVRTRMRLWFGYQPTRELMIARADGFVVSVYTIRFPHDDAHARNLRALFAGYCPFEVIWGEQPVNQAGGPAGIREEEATCTIEANHQPLTPLTWEEAGSKQPLSWDYADMPAMPAKPAASSQFVVGITEKSA
jgi:hypothetical protein